MPWKKGVSNSGNWTGLSWGLNAKVIYRQVGDFANSWGFGFDGGIKGNYDKWKFGLVARDVTSTFNAWTFSLDERTQQVFQQTNNELPQNGLEIALPRLIAGVGREFNWKKVSLLAELNATFTTDGRRNTLVSANPVSIDPNMGIELGYAKTIYLRMGVGNIQKAKNFDDSKYYTLQPNLGIGLRIRQLYLDYALSDIGNVSDVLYSNVFSLKYQINKSPNRVKPN